MALSDLTDPKAVVAAMDECDRVGRDVFRTTHGFDPSNRYELRRGRRRYDSKAIAGVAYGHQFGRPLQASEFSGGIAQNGAARVLRQLGFSIVDLQAETGPQLSAGTVYTWRQLAARFGFAEDYLGVAGGMISVPAHHALLVITHPGGAKSIDYRDTWDGKDLIYTGRGKHGDQQLVGQNRDVAENRRELYMFEEAGTRKLLYLGPVVCAGTSIEIAPDAAGAVRRVFRFRLQFSDEGARRSTASSPHVTPQARTRRSRPFDPDRRPQPPRPATRRQDPAVTAVRHEKALLGHHELIVVLDRSLKQADWSELGEMPDAIDLWGRNPAGLRVIFEAKTVRDGTERQRVRSAMAQLFEYRFECGEEDDRLCLVTNQPVETRRVELLEALEIAVVVVHDGELFAASPSARALLQGVVQPAVNVASQR